MITQPLDVIPSPPTATVIPYIPDGAHLFYPAERSEVKAEDGVIRDLHTLFWGYPPTTHGDPGSPAGMTLRGWDDVVSLSPIHKFKHIIHAC